MKLFMTVLSSLCLFTVVLYAEEKETKKNRPARTIAGIINGSVITEYDIKTHLLEKYLLRMEGTEEEKRRKIIDMRLNNLKMKASSEIFYQEALRAGTAIPASFMERELNRRIRESGGLLMFVRALRQQRKSYSDYVRELKKEMVIYIYLQGLTRSHSKTKFKMGGLRDIQVTPGEMKEFYEDHPELFQKEKKGFARLVVIYISEYDTTEEAEAVALKVYEKARQGSNFAELAKKYSGGPRAAKGGRYELSGEGGLKTQLARRIQDLNEGGITEVFRLGGTFNVLKLVEQKEMIPLPFDTVQDEIKQEIRKRHARREQKLLKERLLERAYVRPLDLFEKLKQD